jgi:hypothetical protein
MPGLPRKWQVSAVRPGEVPPSHAWRDLAFLCSDLPAPNLTVAQISRVPHSTMPRIWLPARAVDKSAVDKTVD